MQLLNFVKLEQNESVVDAPDRKRNRERRDYLKAIIREDGCVWCYPFVDPRYVAQVISVVVNRQGYLVGTIFSEFGGTKKIVLDRIQTLTMSDFEDDGGTEDGGSSNTPSPESPRQEFSKAWEEYIKDFN